MSFYSYPRPGSGAIDKGPGIATTNTTRVVIATDQTPVPVTFGGLVTGFGNPAVAQRVAAVIGNATGAVDYGPGPATAQTVRVVEASPTQFKQITRDYSASNVTNVYSNLGTALGFQAQAIEIFETGGNVLVLGVGGTDYCYIFPGGNDGRILIDIANGAQLQVKTLAGTVSSGNMYMNIYG